jgi:DNA-directed RNA polymerase specialized sigma24 family protein
VETLSEVSGAEWPVRLVGLCARLRRGGEWRECARPEAWLLLRGALARFLRAYAPRVQAAQPEDLEDLASAKALELLLRAESGAWNPDGRHPAEVAGFVAAVARNGLARLAVRMRRERGPAVDAETVDSGRERPHARTPATPEAAVEAREFVEALVECVGRLQVRARRTWYLRVCCGLSSRDIAAHPEIRMTAPHVDVVVQRAREALRTCLAVRGLHPRDFPAGAHAALWDCISSFEAGLPAPASTERDLVS